MSGTRQSSVPLRGRSILALSTLALLALCCLPGFADASSAGYQYQDAPPTVTGAPPSESNFSGGSKSTSGIGSPAHKNGSGGGGSSAGHEGASAKNGSGSGGGSVNAQQGSQGQAGKSSPEKSKLANSTEPGSSGGGSSPLVPILIAIVLLAGGSVAYVMIRQRRRRASSDSPGSSVSPEAG